MRVAASWRRSRDALLAAAACAAAVVALLVGVVAFGALGVALPLLVVLAAALLRAPGLVAATAVAAAVVCENPDFGLFPQTAHLYDDLLKGFTPLDALFALALAGTAAQVLQDGRPVRLPPPALTLAFALLGLALLSGILVGRDAGVGLKDELLVIHAFVYLALLPLMIVNLRLTARQLRWILGAAVGLGALKAVLGLVVVALGRGEAIDGSTLSYYEPTANWMMTVVLLSVVAAVVTRARPPAWTVLAGALALVALALSYRRSFWIGDALGLVLVVLLGLRVGVRRMAVPVAVLVAVAVWSLGGVALQSDTPLGQRLQSLSASRIEAKPDDRYRIDERANVVAEIRRHPVTGLGLAVPWTASARPLPVEVDPDHLYVHFAVLYWWLKLGILGPIAYAALLAAGGWMSLRVWRGSADPWCRAFGLGSLCSMIALAVIETTTTFSGVDLRFSTLLAAQLGLLAVLTRRAAATSPRW